MEKTALEKSHSKSSNLKLTLICATTSVLVGCMWIVIALYQKLTPGVFYGCLAAVGVLLLGFLFLINRFKR
ncbi:MAG: hypothetical protein ACRC5M_03785 [Anaeroplasmataceae bacterium]